MSNKISAPILKERLHSLDALRGLDMFFLVGLAGIFRALPKLSDNVSFNWLTDQCQHPQWEGFTAYDVIFPMFIFIVGVAIPFSFKKRLSQKGGKHKLYKHIISRTIILSILGVVLWKEPGGAHPTYGFYSVLYRIAFSYLFAGIIMMNTNVKQQAYWAFGILIVYWIVHRFIPIQGYGAGDFSRDGNFNAFVMSKVSLYLSPSFRHVFNPSLLLSVSNALFGVLAGQWLIKGDKSSKKALWLFIAGAGFIVVGLLVHIDFPINKKLGTPSFTLLTSGISAALLALFYWIIDVKGYKKWSFFFIVVGMNSITIYVANSLFNFRAVTNVFVGGFDFGNAQALIFALVSATIKWLFLYYFYKQKVFLKI